MSEDYAVEKPFTVLHVRNHSVLRALQAANNAEDAAVGIDLVWHYVPYDGGTRPMLLDRLQYLEEVGYAVQMDPTFGDLWRITRWGRRYLEHTPVFLVGKVNVPVPKSLLENSQPQAEDVLREQMREDLMKRTAEAFDVPREMLDTSPENLARIWQKRQRQHYDLVEARLTMLMHLGTMMVFVLLVLCVIVGFQ